MKNLKFYIVMCCAAVLSGCIKNDLPYGKVPLSITAMSVSGQIGESVISEKDMTVKVDLEETVNPALTKILNIEYKATLRDNSENNYHQNITSNVKVDDVINLSSPYNVKLSLFQEYDWTIVPNQNIERIFKVEKQMSVPTFDTEKKLAVAYIQKDVPLKDAKLLDLKLGPKGCSQNGTTEGLPALDWKYYKNYNEATVDVVFSDFINEKWTIRIYNFDKDLTKAVHGGTRVAWAYGIAIEGKTCGFEYRKDGDSEWIAVPEEDVVMEGTEFSAVIKGLEPNTKYFCHAKVGETLGADIDFTTTEEIDMTSEEGKKKWNFGFEYWHKDGKVICPWAQDGESFWDSGNKGSTTLSEKDNITTSTDDAYSGSYAARLNSKEIMGVFAAGNLFIGKFIGTTRVYDGVLGFGRSFPAYPTKLTGYYKYQSKNITHTGVGYESMKGQPDTGIIWVAIVSGSPNAIEGNTFVHVETDKANSQGTYFNKDADNVVAYGEFVIDSSVETYKKFTVELKYKKTDVNPSNLALLIVCSASRYGDYFTGGVGSTLLVDEFKLSYDY